MACIKSVFLINLNLHLKYAILPDILVNFNLKYTLVQQSGEQMKFSISSTKIFINRGMSHPLFVHIFMTESEISISTFCTNIFGQFCYISFLNYLASKKKKKKQSKRNACRSFLNTEGFRFTGCDKATPPKILIAVNKFFLPVIKFKFYFETKTPVF